MKGKTQIPYPYVGFLDTITIEDLFCKSISDGTKTHDLFQTLQYKITITTDQKQQKIIWSDSVCKLMALDQCVWPIASSIEKHLRKVDKI